MVIQDHEALSLLLGARELEMRAARIKLIAIDVDGVLTDGAVYYSERGEAMKFIERQTARLGSKPPAYAELARGLMNLNEFLYVR